MMRPLSLFFIYLLACCQVSAQIVNIETKRMQSDTTGWLGDINVNFSASQNQDLVLSADLDAEIQYKNAKNLYLLLGSYGFLKGADENLINSSFLHLRYNRKLGEVLRWELFTQWQDNKVTKIDTRYLVGTGPRFKVVSNKSFHLYLATLLMYEYEKEISKPVRYHRNIRNSSYVSVTWLPVPVIELTSTTFYQPLLKKLDDFRLLNQLALNIEATRKISFGITWSYLFDNKPVAGVPKTNYALTTGLKFNFGL
jgi:Protein of unknown function, DUF481